LVISLRIAWVDAIFSFDEVYRKNRLTLVEDLLPEEKQAA